MGPSLDQFELRAPTPKALALKIPQDKSSRFQQEIGDILLVVITVSDEVAGQFIARIRMVSYEIISPHGRRHHAQSCCRTERRRRLRMKAKLLQDEFARRMLPGSQKTSSIGYWYDPARLCQLPTGIR